jgi:SAM-dependent methyltransferase
VRRPDRQNLPHQTAAAAAGHAVLISSSAHHHLHKFSPHSADRLEHPSRYQLIPPVETLRSLGLNKNMTMADIGAGTGFFSRAASSIVGPEGKVFALDMSEEMLAYLRAKGIPANMEALLSEEYRLPLEDHTIDFSFLSFVMHETPDRQRLLKEISRVTKPSGRIAIVEWKKQEEEHGPAAEERLAADDLEKNLLEYELLDRGDLNESHYFFLVRPAPNLV